MSNFSQFDALGYIGSSPGIGYRSRLLFSSSAQSASFFSGSFGFEIKDKPRYVVFKDDLDVSNGSAIPVNFHYIDTLTGQVRITNNSQKTTGGTSTPSQWINPINGAIMTVNLTGADGNVWQSTNFGASFTDLGIGDGGAQPYNDGRLYGGWYDGTNFIFGYGGGSCWFTTNGTSFSAQSPAFDYAQFPGNNYSSYSGRYYSYSSSGTGYKFRTSRTGADTFVSGYNVVAMSRNGRYLMRHDTTPTLQYSTDGGASWSSFANTPFAVSVAPNYLSQTACCIASDSGDFWITTDNLNTFKYSFSESRWIGYGGYAFPPLYGARGVRFHGAADTECFMARDQSSIANRGQFYGLLLDFPTAIN